MGKDEKERIKGVSFSQPEMGSVLTLLAMLSFLFACMILPLVGQAGAAVPHYGKNYVAFLSVLLISLALAALAVWSKMLRHKIEGSPLPVWSIGLCGVLVFLMIALFLGLLKI